MGSKRNGEQQEGGIEVAGPTGKSRPRWSSFPLAVLAVLAIFAWALVPTTSASAPKAKDVTDAADSVVEEVTTTTEEAVPDPPAVELPPVPAAPSADPPEVPASPPASPATPAEPPAATPNPVSDLPNNVSKVVRGAKSHPAVGAVTGGTKEAVGAAPDPVGAVPEAAAEADRQASDETGASPSARVGQGAAGEVQPAEHTGSSTVAAPEFAPASWFLAHVWPAIALEAGGEPGAALSGITLPALPANLEPGIPPLAQIAGDLFQGLEGSRPVSANLPLPLPDRPAASDRAPTPPWESALSSGARIALYVAIAALLALLAFMLKTELSSAPGRPGHR